VNAVDFHTRHRLLRKISNNSTTRSDVFIVWMSVGFFEAVEHLEDANNNGILDPGEDLNANGQIDRLARIGARLKDSKQHRGFYVVDRSLTEKAAIEVSPFAVRFDYKKFIVYQKTLK